MPYKIKTKKKTTKKKIVKKTTKPKITKQMTTVKMGSGLPKKIVVTHKYNEFVQLYNVSGVTQHYMFSCNGMYDPNLSATGHQPLYFDQFVSLYDHYTVIGSKITWKIAQNNVNQYVTKVALWINDDVTTTPTYEALSEQAGSKELIIPAGSTDVYTRTMNWSAKKSFGGAILGNSLFRGTSTTNPSEVSVFQISAYQPAASPIALDVDVTIEYIAVWTELKDIASS